MTFRSALIVLTALLAIPGISGCAGKTKAPAPVVFYALQYPAPAPELPESENPLPVRLSVEPFRAKAPYDATRIIYSLDAHRRGRYFYHEWLTPPAAMVTDLLIRDFIASRRFEAVVDTREGWVTHHLSGTIDAFYEEDGPDAWFGVISLTAVFLDVGESAPEPRVCFQKTYHRRVPCQRKNPGSLARALSLALSEISGELRTDLFAAIHSPLGEREK